MKSKLIALANLSENDLGKINKLEKSWVLICWRILGVKA